MSEPFDPAATLVETDTAPPIAAVDAPSAAVSSAMAKFHACRWRQTAENGVAEHCTHRDVLPLAGATGFNAEAWCPDCSYYKLRRTPRKREQPNGGYHY